MSSKKNWLEFLDSQGAVIKDQKVIRFNTEPPQPKENFICDLSHFGIISVSGEDSQVFLQNQFCNDVRTVDSNQSQINAYCSPKGRVLSLFRLLQSGNKYLLHLDESTIEPTIKRLSMFVLMSKVTISDERDSLVSIGISGDSIVQYVNKNIITLPDEIDKTTQNDSYSAMRIPGIPARFVLIGEIENMQHLWRKISEKFTPIGIDTWSHMDIESGLPQIHTETMDAFVPQMLNLHSINGLSFKKGCYPGQEVVARMHYLGKLKRRMYLGHITSGSQPQPGDNLVIMGTDQSVGKIVVSAPDTEGGIDFLAVVQISALESDGNITLQDPKKTPVIFKDLPYSVEISREEG